ncbi:MAG TPA: alpha/beta hydrolase, partial [Ktedonobacterales bacterium]|nr:alpha/beta hydrolase [Ktedonobacterales bacterium]
PRELLARIPLALLPEVGFAWGEYRPLLEHFAPGRRVCALDWPGFGASAKPPPADFAYTLANFAVVFARWLDSLGVARAVLLGNGLGAAVALRYALAHPQRVVGLALMGPLGMTVSTGVVERIVQRILRSPWLLRRIEPTLTSLALGPTTAETEAILRRRRSAREGADYAASLAAAVALIRSLSAPDDLSDLGAEARERDARQGLLAQADRVTAPALVMRGALDPLCAATDTRRLAEGLGAHGALEVTLPTAGHLPFLQQPTRCMQAIAGLIATAEANAVQSSSTKG